MKFDLKRGEIVKIFMAQIIASMFTGAVAIGVFHWRLNERLNRIEYDYGRIMRDQERYEDRLRRAEDAANTAKNELTQATTNITNLKESSKQILDTVRDLQRDLTGRVTR